MCVLDRLPENSLPKTLVGRIVASFVMILGVAFVSIVTALIVSELVVRPEAEREEEEHEEGELDIATAIRQLDAVSNESRLRSGSDVQLGEVAPRLVGNGTVSVYHDLSA